MTFPAADCMMELLRSGEREPLRFAASAPEAMTAMLDALFEATGDPRAAIDELFDLAAALEGPLDSPSAGRFLRRLLGRDRRIGPQKIELPDPRPAREKAPMFGSAAPSGSVPASALLARQPAHRR